MKEPDWKRWIENRDIKLIADTKGFRERASYDASASFELVLVEKARQNAAYLINKVRDILGAKAA